MCTDVEGARVRNSSPAAERMVVERYRRIMATQVGVHVSATPKTEREALAAITACLDWMEDVERTLTRFDAGSELSRLNDAGGQWREASELLFGAVEQSIAAAHETDGLFDPTLLSILEALGYDRDFALVRTAAQPASTAGGGANAALGRAVAGDWRDIEMDAPRRRIRLPRGTRLDLGGIAKGWAADIALDRFFAAFPDALINVGGDIRVRGGPQTSDSGTAWPIGIGATAETSPEQRGALPVVALARGGVATSGAGDRWWYQAGQRRHHLIDPRTGRPAHVWIDRADGGEQGQEESLLIAAAAAMAPSAAHAEIAAKVAVLRGYPAALSAVERAWNAWAERRTDDEETAQANTNGYGDAPVALVLLMGSGEVIASTNLQAYLDTLGGGGNAWLI